MLSALLLYSFENETEENSIFKKIMEKINNQLFLRSIMYIIGVKLLLTIYAFYYFTNVYPYSFSRTFTILYLIFSRTLFVLGLSLILIPTFMGHNRLTSWIFSQSFFAPLSKLTYGVYLVHPIFILFSAYNTPGGEYSTMNKGIVNYIAWVVVSFLVSYISFVVVEIPCANLEGIFLFKRANKCQNDNRLNEEPIDHFKDKTDFNCKDRENQYQSAPYLIKENKDEFSSECAFEDEKNISAYSPLIK